MKINLKTVHMVFLYCEANYMFVVSPANYYQQETFLYKPHSLIKPLYKKHFRHNWSQLIVGDWPKLS